MAWRIEITATAARQLAKLDRQHQKAIVLYLRERVEPSDDPRSMGKALVGDKSGLWRYRVGDFRLICQIIDDRLVVELVTVGHRGAIYR